MRLNSGLIPPNGYHFPVADGVTLKAATKDLLVREIEKWRVQNAIDVGNPEKDIDNYFCSKWPHFCLAESHEAPENPRYSLLKMVNGWAVKKLRDQPPRGYPLVNQPDAEKRCKSCIECPFNKQWRSDCGECMKATDTILIRLRQLRKIALDDGLLGCSINGHDNRTAIHFQIADLALTSERLAALPQNCWIKNSTD